jgi:hypothetical protein
LAPFVVIQKLIQLYPEGIQCTDKEGMLPIHLAFGFGATEQVLAFLLEPFQLSMSIRGRDGRLPHECCELGPNKVRGQLYKIATDKDQELEGFYHGRSENGRFGRASRNRRQKACGPHFRFTQGPQGVGTSEEA